MSQAVDIYERSRRLLRTGEFLADLGRDLLGRRFGKTSVSVSPDGTLVVTFDPPDEAVSQANVLTRFADDDLLDLMSRLTRLREQSEAPVDGDDHDLDQGEPKLEPAAVRKRRC